MTFGIPSRQNASGSAHPLLFQVKSSFKRLTTAPSKSGTRSVLTVVGKKAFKTIDSQMLVAMKMEIAGAETRSRFGGTPRG